VVPNLPLQHFRRAVAELAATPEAHALAFEGTGVSQQMLASPDFALTPEILFAVCDNVTASFGKGWYCNLPGLWALDVQSDFEAAMRFAPTLRDAMNTVERFGPVRWPIVRWENVMEGDVLRSKGDRNVLISSDNWQMLGVIFALNFESILSAAFPQTTGMIVHEISGDPPLPEADLARLFRNPVRWNVPVHAALIPAALLDLPSSLADARAFSAMIAVLETHAGVPRAGWRTRAANVLGDAGNRRLSGEEVAAELGVSLRTLERHLADEGTGFRELLDEFLKSRLEVLMRRPGLSLAGVAEQLGYSDESALSRATRRWHGCSAAEARRRIRGESLAQ
jgi:AraC-like DNA-binding protein